MRTRLVDELCACYRGSRALARPTLTIDLIHTRSTPAKSLGATANLHIFCRSGWGRKCIARPEVAEAVVRIARAYAGAATHGGSGRRFTVEQVARGSTPGALNSTANESRLAMLYTLGAREFLSGPPTCFAEQSAWTSSSSSLPFKLFLGKRKRFQHSTQANDAHAAS